MSESEIYHLDRLSYGVLVDENQQQASPPGVIARTGGVTAAQVAECLRVGQMLPPAAKDSSPEMPGALALLQSRTAHCILVKAQRSDAGFPQLMYVLVPLDVMRQLGGNVLAFRSWLASMRLLAPQFHAATLRVTTHPPGREEQSDALLDLLLCQDSISTVETCSLRDPGWPVAIINSPRSLAQRPVRQGLLSLLPVPARTGITFATRHRRPPHRHSKFAGRSPPQTRSTTGTWPPVNKPPRDAYGRYIVCNFASIRIVIHQPELARTTWRYTARAAGVGAGVGRAPGVDQTVLDGWPADRALVASVLRETHTTPGPAGVCAASAGFRWLGDRVR